MRLTLAMIAAIGCFLPVSAILAVAPDESMPPREEPINYLAPLKLFMGKWEKEFELSFPEQGSKKVKKTGTHTGQWILSETHYQESGKDSDGSEYLMMISCDSKTGEFKANIYQSNGLSSTLTGTFNAATSTFTWADNTKGKDFRGTYQFVDPQTMKFRFVEKDAQGKVFFKLEGTAKKGK